MTTTYSDSRKDKFKNLIIKGARSYSKLVNKQFLIYTENHRYFEVSFYINDFKHLTGIKSDLNDTAFYNLCLNGNITKNNISDSQKYNLNTLKHKTKKIQLIDKLMFSDSKDTLVITNLIVDTTTFPLAIKNIDKNLCIGFVGDDNHARSLRKQSTPKNLNEENIIAIFEMDKLVNKEKYHKIVYFSQLDNILNSDFDILNNFTDNLIEQFNKLSIKKLEKCFPLKEIECFQFQEVNLLNFSRYKNITIETDKEITTLELGLFKYTITLIDIFKNKTSKEVFLKIIGQKGDNKDKDVSKEEKLKFTLQH